jgi:hypothetical protein
MFITISLIFNNLIAQESKVNINKLTEETQKMSEESDEMFLVWWIPEEFWKASFAGNPDITQAQTEDFLKIIRPYTLVVVVDGKIGSFGGITYKPEGSIRESIEVKDKNGITYRPIRQDEIENDTQNFLSIMKPIFVNMLGQMGENMHFVLFPAKNKQGQNLVDPKVKGTFTVNLDNKNFTWKLPLGSLLPQKVCSVCGEKLSGAYSYCPWDGSKLQ